MNHYVCLNEDELREVASGTANPELFDRSIAHYPGCMECGLRMQRLSELRHAPQRVSDLLISEGAKPLTGYKYLGKGLFVPLVSQQ